MVCNIFFCYLTPYRIFFTSLFYSISRIPRATALSEGKVNQFSDRASASKSRESSRSPERYQGNLKQYQQIQQQFSNNTSSSSSSPREIYKTTLEHQPRGNGGGSISSNKSSVSSNIPAATADESQVEERLRALIAMLGKNQASSTHNASKEKENNEGRNGNEKELATSSKHTNSTAEAPNRGMGLGLGNLEPLIGGNLPADEQGTLQYLSQLETVARRLKDQLLQDQQKVCTRIADYL